MHQLLRDRRPSGLFRAAIAVLAMVVLVAACGDDGDAESDATPEETISSEATEDTTAAPELEGELVFAGGGGAIGALYKSLLDEFAAEHNVTVTYVEGTSSSGFARIQAEARADQRVIDIQNQNDQTVILGRGQGLWEELDMSLLPNAERLEQDLAFPAGVVGDPPSAVRLLVIPQGLAYNTEIFEANGWEDRKSTRLNSSH